MKPKNRLWVWVILILALVAGVAILSYNGLVSREEQVKLKWSDLQNAYQRRLDLTPNLVAVVKASSAYEQETLEQVAAARAKAMQVTASAGPATAENYRQQEAAQAAVTQSLNRVIGVIEKYPDLKSGKSYLMLQSQLEGTERRIKVSRNDFNGAVAEYNKSVRSFPRSVFASVFGFRVKEGFQADPGSENSPEVKFPPAP